MGTSSGQPLVTCFTGLVLLWFFLNGDMKRFEFISADLSGLWRN